MEIILLLNHFFFFLSRDNFGVQRSVLTASGEQNSFIASLYTVSNVHFIYTCRNIPKAKNIF